ncbi:hypothetical protein HJC23_008050 [Cyclotella cryptica]|uniref:Nuclear condensin complex subunit 3 C-terminal domain-containing protein n=1 Tax=Cyclotella cryptica TaxID=29204 RepID=A0ABD3NL82_9STRA|eukprot:CCRYP_020568-RA/>CCRYP_020568-RA protein AED:0.01 eAED:0.01 QI:202/1/1/1/1/1/2/1556/1025
MTDATATITSIVHTHFAAHQRENEVSKRTADHASPLSPSSLRAAASLRDEISQFALSNLTSSLEGMSLTTEGEAVTDAGDITSKAVLGCIDCAMSCLANNPRDCWESVHSTLELAVAVACSDKQTGLAVVNRAIDYISVPKDVVRIEGCNMLGWCVGQFVAGGKAAAPILKKGGKKKSAKTDHVDDWKLECVIGAGRALLLRLTDKIAKVRSAAMAASSFFFLGGAKLFHASEDFVEISAELEATLLWLASNDSSAANRALAVQCIPGSEDNIQSIIVRVKDVDAKVREAALESLREKVGLSDLTEDQMVEILRTGLTKRCSSTHSKTVELLICNWMKQLKYDPITLLDMLNPVLNESECEKAVKVIINVASAIDCEASGDKSIELVRKHFGAPELRSFQQVVMRKLSILQNDDEELTPSMVFFLRVKCSLTTESAMPSSSKADTISDVINDIPTLCNILNAHLDKLIEFNKRDGDELDMDEDEAAAFEDGQHFICLQLIHMAKVAELQEEGSRRHFVSIMRSMLSRLETPDDLVDACVKAMASAHDTEAQFVQTISEVLVDVEDDDSYSSPRNKDDKAIAIVRQMRVIAILSIVLENISSHMVGHPILDGFFEHLSPAITSKNAVVREHGVICLSKFCLLSEENKVMDQFRPLLMTIAGSADERVEVRAQAAMALCDLALIHDKMLNPSGAENDSLKDLLLEMLGHSKPGIVVIAAEITAKLLLAGRFDDPILVAWLVAIFFDSNLIESQTFQENDTVDEIGSPVRLQQLLSIFFPTYSMSSLDANDSIMASIGPLLSIINHKMEGLKQNKALSQWPISKMVDYICYNVDIADKTKKTGPTAELHKCENELIDPTEPNPLGDETVGETTDSSIIEASSTLLASIDIAEYLAETSSHIPSFYTRALAKILGSACIDINAEDKTLLSRLKSHVCEAEYSIEDGPSLTAIRKLSKLLADVDDESSEEESGASEDEADGGDIANALEKVTLLDSEKENPRLSSGTLGSALSKGRNRDSSSRVRLGSIN